jgi:hypothetical protein
MDGESASYFAKRMPRRRLAFTFRNDALLAAFNALHPEHRQSCALTCQGRIRETTARYRLIRAHPDTSRFIGVGLDDCIAALLHAAHLTRHRN